jgi:hypothetical protein
MYRREYSKNLHRPLWEGDWGVVKKSGRDEPIWVVTYICLETTQGISLHSYLHLKLAKMSHFFLLFLCFFSSKKSENKRLEQVLPGGRVGGDGSNNVSHVSKCKNS